MSFLHYPIDVCLIKKHHKCEDILRRLIKCSYLCEVNTVAADGLALTGPSSSVKAVYNDLTNAGQTDAASVQWS